MAFRPYRRPPRRKLLTLRLQNGLYMQKHAYMLRMTRPYGTFASDQPRMLGSRVEELRVAGHMHLESAIRLMRLLYCFFFRTKALPIVERADTQPVGKHAT
jgi:hypothetical protein